MVSAQVFPTVINRLHSSFNVLITTPYCLCIDTRQLDDNSYHYYHRLETLAARVRYSSLTNEYVHCIV